MAENATVANCATVQSEGGRQVSRNITYFHLDAIISVGYRVKSLRGTQFHIRASTVLRGYLIKGFAMNDELLKQAGGGLSGRTSGVAPQTHVHERPDRAVG